MKAPQLLPFWKACLCVLLFASCQKEVDWTYKVTSYAGGLLSGTLEGSKDSVYFAGPENLAVGSTGDLYVSDRNSHWIRKIVPFGTVELVAGETQGFVNGSRSVARFNTPQGLAVDKDNNVYVADMYNHSIRKIRPDGYVSTLAGNGSPGFADSVGQYAGFSQPSGVAVDAKGSVYVADAENNRIRKITPDGRVSTLAGGESGYTDGEGKTAQFYNPVDLSLDGAGNLYVADRGNNCIRKVTPSGRVSTLAGDGLPGFVDGVGDKAEFDNPWGVASDKSGNVYVADSRNNRIRKITPNGSVSTIAGTGTAGFSDGEGATAQFNNPKGIALDARADFLFIADGGNKRIRKIDLR